MKLAANLFCHFAIHARDGEMGKVRDIYFDDVTWRIRYLVVDTRKWLPGKKVLLSPESVKTCDPQTKTIELHLSRRQVEASPNIDEHVPISRNHELELSEYYGWSQYWNAAGPGGLGVPLVAPSLGLGLTGAGALPIAAEGTFHDDSRNPADVNLRSCQEVIGYFIQAIDEEVGHVSNFVVDTERWALPYVLANTRNWLPGKKTLIPTSLIRSITWEEKSIYVGVTAQGLRNAPAIDIDSLTFDDERRLRGYFADLREVSALPSRSRSLRDSFTETEMSEHPTSIVRSAPYHDDVAHPTRDQNPG